MDPTNYTNNVRAILFDKYAPNISNWDNFKSVMRLNNYSDTGNYCNAIAARCDLESNTTFPFGAVDCKATDAFMAKNHESWIIDGPTDQDLPPFNWDNWPQFASSRIGMPSLWNFSWNFWSPDSQGLTEEDIPSYSTEWKIDFE